MWFSQRHLSILPEDFGPYLTGAIKLKPYLVKFIKYVRSRGCKSMTADDHARIIDAVARRGWALCRDDDCPPEYIPNESDLIGFIQPINRCSEDVVKSLNNLYYVSPKEVQDDIDWRWIRAAPNGSSFCYEGDGSPNLGPNELPSTGGCLAVLSVGTIGYTIRSLGEINADWKRAGMVEHPLLPLIREWQTCHFSSYARDHGLTN